MKKTIQVINDLVKEGVIESYAMGGATALLFYAEPALTFDVDIFVFLPGDDVTRDIVDLGHLYTSLESKGYHAEKEHVMIEGVPVQFIPAYNALVVEAVERASVKEYEGVSIRVLKIEHLMAIMVDTNRPKDRERIGKLTGEISFDRNMLESILKRHSLLERWERQIEKK